MDFRCRAGDPRDAELRYNLFLALKEALNNIVKHARATKVRGGVAAAAGREKAFTLSVEDNGQGLGRGGGAAASGRISSGSGLTNLEKRLAAVGGRCEIHSERALGTQVRMTVFISGGGITSYGDWPG